MEVRKLRFFSSIRTKFALSYLAVVLFVLALINTYFLIATRDMIYESKQQFVQDQANFIASHIEENFDSLTYDDRERLYTVVTQLELVGGAHIIITDAYGVVLYGQFPMSMEEEFYAFRIDKAISGFSGYEIVNVGFFDGSIFTSAFRPIVSRGEIIGAIGIHEEDPNQGLMLLEMQETILNISIIVALFSILAVTLILWSVMRRLSSIMSAIESVREGKYEYLISMRGRDELAILGDEFNSLTSKIRETDEIRRRFVADASHELKTPLASIRLLADSILQNKNIDNKTANEFIEDIGIEAERLSRITEKLLTLTKLDGQVNTADELIKVEMKEAITSTIRMLRPLAVSNKVTLRVHLTDNCFVSASEDSLHHIIFNLVENAIKYNQPDGSVLVRLESTDDNVILSVMDRGFGIPDEDMPHIFERFYRVDKARSRDAGGSGLGLSIVNDAVKRLGGKISVEKRNGGGMHFTVAFIKY